MPNYEELAKNKFSVTERNKLDGCIYIKDNDTGNYVGLYGKIFRAKSLAKAAETLWQLQEAYKTQLMNEEK
ncbi:hypothetical protein VP14_113 [Vibrio phage VPMCC14]|nr:hypothetical protein VP14_113 [Vibrio phage VPMCC14]